MGMAAWNEFLGTVSSFIYSHILILLLVSAGLYFTFRTRAVQLRMFGHMWANIMKSRSVEGEGISSFQAFAIGIASRVGTGNIMGVALALILGGPGAVFWMWVIALIGMATAFVEASLAQMFKIRATDGTFRGGPAYYISRGLGSRRWGLVFACCLIFTFGFSYNLVQAKTISGVLQSTFQLPAGLTALGLVLLCAPIIFGGIKRIARAAAIIAPVMALAYVALALLIIILNYRELPRVFALIFSTAFEPLAVGGGLVGGLSAAVLNGAKRGLYSNEAGMGSAPNAAATATVAHPVQQGLIQSMGVFVDTILICSATAFICIISGVYQPGKTAEALAPVLTQQSIAAQLGAWTKIPVALIIFVFAYSSILGNYSYAEVNLDFIRGVGKNNLPLRLLAVFAVGLGAVLDMGFVINLADLSQAAMAIINLVALFLMGGWAVAALRDYERQWAKIRRGESHVLHFRGIKNPDLPKDLPESVWVEDYGVVPRA